MDHAARKKVLAGKAQTVLGPIDPADLGLTLMHEHLLSYAPHIAKEPAEASKRARYHEPVSMGNLGEIRFGGLLNLDNCQLDDVETAIDEARLFKLAGGSTIVEPTSIGIGRDPRGLARIARATGLNIVMGASYYVDETHPPARRMTERSEDEIVDEIVGDVLDGVDGTGVRAGFIGEVGCSRPLTANERSNPRMNPTTTNTKTITVVKPTNVKNVRNGRRNKFRIAYSQGSNRKNINEFP